MMLLVHVLVPSWVVKEAMAVVEQNLQKEKESAIRTEMNDSIMLDTSSIIAKTKKSRKAVVRVGNSGPKSSRPYFVPKIPIAYTTGSMQKIQLKLNCLNSLPRWPLQAKSVSQSK